MAHAGEQTLTRLLADLGSTAGARGLTRTLATLKAPNPKASFRHVSELRSLAGEIVAGLDKAEAALEDQINEVAEDHYARTVDLMVELKFRSAAQPGLRKPRRTAQAQITVV